MTLYPILIAILLLQGGNLLEALDRGRAAQLAGDHTLAIAAYQECLELDPDNAECHWQLGWSYWVQNRWPEVVAHWQRTRELNPEHPEVDRYLERAEGYLALIERIREEASGAPPTTPAVPDSGVTIRIRAVGDIMMYTDYPDPVKYKPPDDGRYLLADVTGWLSDADLTFGNLEGPLCDGGKTSKCKPGSNCYAFRTPTRYGAYLKDAGFNLISTANNHSGDFGSYCLSETERVLNELDIAWAGRPGTIASVNAAGFRVGMIAFHTSADGNDLNDLHTAKELVRVVAHGHDIVVVSFHGGAEGERAIHVPDGPETFYGEQRGDLRRFSRAVIDAGADLVIGHGPHVLRGMEIIDDRLVAYSLGNFATYARFNMDGPRSISTVLEVELDHEGRLLNGTILPVELEGEGIPKRDPQGTAIDLLRSLSHEDFPKSAPVIARDGSFVADWRLASETTLPTLPVPESDSQ